MMIKKKKKIGILGGTFDPIHKGHLHVATEVQKIMHLDEIWFVPVRINPLKTEMPPASCEDRIKMIELAICDHPSFSVNEIECYREGPSYSVDTLRLFKKQHPDFLFYFIVGSDVIAGYEKWKSGPEILKLCTIIVATRPEENPKEVPEKIKNDPRYIFVSIPPLDISSTSIRKKIQSKHDVNDVLPHQVMRYILENKLYH